MALRTQPWSHLRHTLLVAAGTKVGPGGGEGRDFSPLGGSGATLHGKKGLRRESCVRGHLETIFCDSLHVSLPRGLAGAAAAGREAEGALQPGSAHASPPGPLTLPV